MDPLYSHLFIRKLIIAFCCRSNILDLTLPDTKIHSQAVSRCLKSRCQSRSAFRGSWTTNIYRYQIWPVQKCTFWRFLSRHKHLQGLLTRFLTELFLVCVVMWWPLQHLLPWSLLDTTCLLTSVMSVVNIISGSAGNIHSLAFFFSMQLYRRNVIQLKRMSSLDNGCYYSSRIQT